MLKVLGKYSLIKSFFDILKTKLISFCYQELEEKRGRRICFYERDAEAGVAMTTNLVRMVTSSSRVICLLSRDYGLSAWCKYQVQMSLATMHQRRGMKFVVPVLLKVCLLTVWIFKLKIPLLKQIFEEFKDLLLKKCF